MSEINAHVIFKNFKMYIYVLLQYKNREADIFIKRGGMPVDHFFELN